MNATPNSRHRTCSRRTKTRAGGFPILVSMIPRPVGVAKSGCPPASRRSTGGVGKNCSALNLWYLLQMVLFRSRSSELVDECLHHICLPLSLSLSLSPLLSNHARDSRSATQRQLHYTVERRFPTKWYEDEKSPSKHTRDKRSIAKDMDVT